MIRREAQFQTLFRHWIKANPMNSSAFELKQTQTDSISFDAVQDHQIMALRAVTMRGGLLYKAPDDSRGFKPFDMFYLAKAFAYIVIKYPDFFCLIEVENFIVEKKWSKKKSLTSEQARKISNIIVELKKPH